jgi:hypothetical protein
MTGDDIMTGLILSRPESVTGKLTTYAAKYNIEFFERKIIPSYALWSVYIKIGHRYPKTPQGYGATGNYADVYDDMLRFIAGNNILFGHCRNDGLERWKKIKQLIMVRDFNQVPLLHLMPVIHLLKQA